MLNCKKTESDFTQKSKQNSTISVAAAANLRDVLEELKQIYMNENPDKKVEITFGSSGLLVQQILNGASFNNSILLDTENRIVLPAQKRNISIMFQNYALFPNMTVKQNIAFAQKDKNPDIIDYYLEKFNLKILENVFPSKLSGGQQQRVALARTLVQNAEIILLDEPLSAVDASLPQSMMEEILKINQNQGSTIFMISHNEREFQKVSLNNLIIS